MGDGPSASLLRRLAGFSALPLISSLAPLILLPVIARNASTPEWVAIAVGSSLGGLATIAVSFGWTLTGPVQVATANAGGQKALYFSALVTRLTVFTVVAPTVCYITLLLAEEDVRSLAAFTALAGAVGGLSPTWFAVGIGRPRDVAIFETLPRLLSAALALILISENFNLIIYPIATLVASVGAGVVYTARIARIDGSSHAFLNYRPTIRRQAAPAMTTMFAAAYTALAVSLVAASTTSQQSAMFASGTRLYQFMLLGLIAVSQSLLADIRSGRQTTLHRKRARRLHVGIGLCGGLGIAIFGPSLTKWIFTVELGIDTATSLPYGLAYLLITGNTYLTQQVFIPGGLGGYLLRSVFVGALVGVPATMILSRHFGSAGGAWALVLAEASTLMVMVLLMRLYAHPDTRSDEVTVS